MQTKMQMTENTQRGDLLAERAAPTPRRLLFCASFRAFQLAVELVLHVGANRRTQWTITKMNKKNDTTKMTK